MQTTETKIMITAQDVKPGDSYVGLFDQPRTVVKVITKGDKTLILFNDDCSRSHHKSHIVTVIRKVPEVAESVCLKKLAAQVVNYCGIKTLSLGGLVERIKAAGTMTRETADAVIDYCQENSLTLGGLVSSLAIYSNSVADQVEAQAVKPTGAKVRIVSLKPASYTQDPQVMTWEQYQEFCKVTPGEGDTWKAVLI